MAASKHSSTRNSKGWLPLWWPAAPLLLPLPRDMLVPSACASFTVSVCRLRLQCEPSVHAEARPGMLRSAWDASSKRTGIQVKSLQISFLEGNRKARSERMMARQHSERNRISLPRTLIVARCFPAHAGRIEGECNSSFSATQSISQHRRRPLINSEYE